MSKPKDKEETIYLHVDDETKDMTEEDWLKVINEAKEQFKADDEESKKKKLKTDGRGGQISFSCRLS